MTVQTGEVVGKDPDEITREIEQTRVELAETIDELADRLSPRRVAERGVARARSRVQQFGGRGPAVAGAEGTAYETTRRLRAGRVALAAVAVTALAVTIVVLRRRR